MMRRRSRHRGTPIRAMDYDVTASNRDVHALVRQPGLSEQVRLAGEGDYRSDAKWTSTQRDWPSLHARGQQGTNVLSKITVL